MQTIIYHFSKHLLVRSCSNIIICLVLEGTGVILFCIISSKLCPFTQVGWGGGGVHGGTETPKGGGCMHAHEKCTFRCPSRHLRT